LQTVTGKEPATIRRSARRFPSVLRRWAIAATVAIMIATAASLLVFKGKRIEGRYDYASVTPTKRLIENVNTSGKPVLLTLPDLSTVTLSPNSRIAYANNFEGGTRDVYLLGEALFTVTKNPARPFRVFANEIVTKVLGTSFTVRSFEKDTTISVAVNTGKVSVYLQEESRDTQAPGILDGIILSPNQELLYQKKRQKFQKVLRDNPRMIVPAKADMDLIYTDYSLEKVLDQLSRNYGISIVFDNDLLKSCTITADLRNVPFYDKLDLICRAIGARYEIIDGQVVVQTNGCR
jgi:ferric-dicitrate binding protein FerR (iron transport regulator)